MSKLAKVAKQHDKTWAQLNRRLISLPFDYDSLFTPQVAEFVKNKAASTGSSPGYLVPCLITTTAYVIAENCLIRCGPQEMPANLFMVFVGPPGIGKSQVLKEGALKPIHELQTERDLSNCIIEKCTSSALVKTIADLKKAYVLSPEVYDVLNKLLKSDEENATGDVQILCELFSGESTSYRYATERTREIPSNVPFSILGCTQVPYAARLLCRMDQGHGLLDRFMFVFPVCLRPTTAETNAARLWLDGENVHLKEVSDIFIEMFDAHESAVTSHYTFSNDALDTLTSLKDDFIKEVNDAIQDANIPPKSKKIDLLQRVATTLHVFNFITNELLHGRKPPAPPTEISLETLQQAQRYVDYVETQKDIVMKVITLLLSGTVDEERSRPENSNIKTAILLFPGRVVLYRGFPQAAPREVRQITMAEFRAVAEELEPTHGNVVITRLRRQSKDSVIFIKRRPNDIPDLGGICSEEQYSSKYDCPLHPTITTNVKNTLLTNGHVSAGFFN